MSLISERNGTVSACPALYEASPALLDRSGLKADTTSSTKGLCPPKYQVNSHIWSFQWKDFAASVQKSFFLLLLFAPCVPFFILTASIQWYSVTTKVRAYYNNTLGEVAVSSRRHAAFPTPVGWLQARVLVWHRRERPCGCCGHLSDAPLHCGHLRINRPRRPPARLFIVHTWREAGPRLPLTTTVLVMWNVHVRDNGSDQCERTGVHSLCLGLPPCVFGIGEKRSSEPEAHSSASRMTLGLSCRDSKVWGSWGNRSYLGYTPVWREDGGPIGADPRWPFNSVVTSHSNSSAGKYFILYQSVE